MEALEAVAQFFKEYGWMGIAILLFFGGMTRVYVFRWQDDQKQKRIDDLEAQLVQERKEYKEALERKDAKLEQMTQITYGAVDKLGTAIDMLGEAKRDAERIAYDTSRREGSTPVRGGRG